VTRSTFVTFVTYVTYLSLLNIATPHIPSLYVIIVGMGCTKKQLKKYYDPIGPHRAAFANAGGIMGSLPALEIMFAHIVNNEKMYRKLTWRLKWFCDQNALAHWRSNNTHLIEIDHQQEVFGTLPFQTPYHKLSRHNDGVCRNESGDVHHTCVEIVPS
jgi:hypothetical protein